jgi:serine/threonine protein kinase
VSDSVVGTSIGAGAPLPQRIARALASPAGVLVTMPLLVAAVGVAILLVGRDATATEAEDDARAQLSEQAVHVQQDVAVALDQADWLLPRLRVLADPARPLDDTLVRLHDLLVGRPGVEYLSLSFPDGTFRGAYVTPDGTLEVQESRLGSTADRYRVTADKLAPIDRKPTTYDPRERGFYKLAALGQRAWTDPYQFFNTAAMGVTCAEPIMSPDGTLRAVLTVDFQIDTLSRFIARPALDDARTLVYTSRGTLLAYPGATARSALRADDLHDPAVDALLERAAPSQLAVTDLETTDGAYLAAVAPIGGKRASVAVPLDWLVATVVPARTLLAPTRALERRSIIASAIALAAAVVLALALAWNLVRLRRQLSTARTAARTAEARARALGSYELVHRLGAGGMGEVWRAEHTLLARTAAIKLIRADVIGDRDSQREVQERFRREAQTLASMRSRHTIAIYDYGVTTDGTLYYVMELLDGLDLEVLVRDFGPVPAARVVQLLAQACASLAEAHDAGLLHRDIKPQNLMACRAADEVDVIKLLDFGIVYSMHEKPAEPVVIDHDSLPELSKLTHLGRIVGTPGFIAPEQLVGDPSDRRADLYSLGCVAWWLLTGREVFGRELGEEVLLRRHLGVEPPSLREVCSGWIPAELDQLVAQLLDKDPDARPADARVVAARLRAIADAIPPEHTWTQPDAEQWWRIHRPAPPSPRQSLRSIPSQEAGTRVVVVSRA